MIEWARKWGVSPEALQDLVGVLPEVPNSKPGKPEATVVQDVRLAASRAGDRAWRNNRGACVDRRSGRHIRYGIANDSQQLNEIIKSSDLIGIKRRLITLADVGITIGQFASYECKRPGWKYTGTPREQAQLAWLALIIQLGGIGKFITSGEDL